MSTRFNPLADDPMAPPVPEAPEPAAPKRSRRRAAAAPVAPPAPEPTAFTKAVRAVPDGTLLFLSNGTPLDGLTGDEIRERILAHGAAHGPFADWRRAWTGLIALAATPPIAPENPIHPEPVPRISQALTLLQEWRDRLQFPIAVRQ